MYTRKKKVIVVEGDWIVREAYKYYFKTFENYELVSLYNSTEDALKDFENANPDIVLSDITLPGKSGIEGVKKYKALKNEVKILIVSIRNDFDVIKDLVNGNLEKPLVREELLLILDSLQ